MPPTRNSVMIGGRVLQFTVRKHRRARSASVRVSRRRGVLVTLPWRVPLRIVPRLMAEWEPWLLAELEQVDVWNGPRVKQYATGSELYVLGLPRRLRLEPLPAGRVRNTAHLDFHELTLGLDASSLLDPRPALEKYLRKLARDDLNVRCEHWADVVGREPKRIIIGERTSRWGSCSRSGTLSFCYRLAMAPPATIDAVVAHEMCHLVHLNHSPRFYALLDRVCAGHREAMKWLDRHQEELIL